MKKTGLFLLLPFLLISCGEDFFYDKEMAIDSEGWSYDKTADFDFEIQDSTKQYSLFLDISHTTDFPYQNLYYNFKMTLPSGKSNQEQISTNLADKIGRWYGKCNSEACDLRIVLQEKTQFKELGKYQVSVGQWTRDSLLKEVKNIAFRIQEQE